MTLSKLIQKTPIIALSFTQPTDIDVSLGFCICITMLYTIVPDFVVDANAFGFTHHFEQHFATIQRIVCGWHSYNQIHHKYDVIIYPSNVIKFNDCGAFHLFNITISFHHSMDCILAHLKGFQANKLTNNHLHIWLNIHFISSLLAAIVNLIVDCLWVEHSTYEHTLVHVAFELK